MSDNTIKDALQEALQKAYDHGYAKGRVDALKALSTSLNFVYGAGILTEEEKKGYKIVLETVDATRKILEQDNEEKGY